NEEGSVYRMDVKGGFYFDKLLNQGGVKSDSELISFITNNITRGLMKMEIKETDIGCSSFTAVTKGGDRLFARNYDFAKTNVCITLCNPGSGRHKSFSTVDLNYVGMDIDKDVTGLMNKITCLAAPFAPLDGINDAGVACGIYMSYQGEETVATDQNDPEKAHITSTTMLRLVLDYADSVDEAVELIQSYNLHDSANTSFHYMVADATGKSAILEWVPENGTDKTDNDGSARKLVVHYNTGDDYLGTREADAEFQWITNFILQPNYYEEGDEKAGEDRYDRIYERLNATDGVVENEEAAMDILKEVGRRTWNGGGGVTVHSAVYNLTQKTVLWVANENYGDKTATYEYSLVTGKLKTVG
ncbi:MAG: linear amide C-N hydrolase, partial [Clostridia bacterium]|nr:linear amide C-N hydrolase [Clostridia bacterium]